MPARESSSTPSMRESPHGLWIVAAVLMVLRVALGVVQDRHPPASTDKVRWVAAAKAADPAGKGKPTLYVFSATWCGPCKLMQREVFEEQAIADRINRDFTPVHVLEGGEPGLATAAEASALQRKYGVQGFPTLVVVAAGRPPSTLRGYPGKASVLSFLLGGWANKQGPDALHDHGDVDQATSHDERQALAAGGAIIVGKLETSDGGDPRATWSQATILPGGYFRVPVLPDAKSLQFRQDGYAPVDLTLGKFVLKGVVRVPPVRLRALPATELARVHGHVTAPHLDSVRVDHHPELDDSLMHGLVLSFHPRKRHARLTVRSDGTLMGEGLSPGRHRFGFSAAGAVHQSLVVDLKQGEDRDLGNIALKPMKTVTLRYYASNTGDFSQVAEQTKTVHGYDGLEREDVPPFPDSHFFAQEDGEILVKSIWRAWAVYDLGLGRLEDFRGRVNPAGPPIEMQERKLEPGHVYLWECESREESVLFEASGLGT